MSSSFTCPICLQTEILEGPTVENLPVAHVIPSNYTPISDDFGRLTLSRCSSCTHLWNSADTNQYLSQPFLTNRPVSPAMNRRHRELVESLDNGRRLRILDIGAGSGAISKGFAEKGHTVTAVDSQLRFLDGSSLDAVRIFSTDWPVTELLREQFDLVLCVQVLEHIKQPFDFLQSILDVVSPNGCLYIEVPCGDWIIDNGSIIDLHLAHLHYFSDSSISTLMSRLDCSVLGRRKLLGGRDIGYLIQRSVSDSSPAQRFEPHQAGVLNFKKLIRSSSFLLQNVAQLKGPTAVYGANGGSQSLFGWLPDGPWSLLFDDTSEYWGACGYSLATRYPIVEPDTKVLKAHQNILIASYIHDLRISQKLLDLRYQGSIFTLRPPRVVELGPKSILEKAPIG